jgi:hypothetical protein
VKITSIFLAVLNINFNSGVDIVLILFLKIILMKIVIVFVMLIFCSAISSAQTGAKKLKTLKSIAPVNKVEKKTKSTVRVAKVSPSLKPVKFTMPILKEPSFLLQELRLIYQERLLVSNNKLLSVKDKALQLISVNRRFFVKKDEFISSVRLTNISNVSDKIRDAYLAFLIIDLQEEEDKNALKVLKTLH